MRALVLNDFHHLQVQQRRRPEPLPDEVLVRILATGICGSDLHGFTGENGRRVPGQVMGHETVGRIAALGDAVGDGLQPGRLVTINPVIACQTCAGCRNRTEQHCPNKRVLGVDPALISTFAEFCAVPARNVVPLADDLVPEHGALVEPLAVAHHAVRRAGVTAQDTVLVIGGGPIGQSVILAAIRAGARAVVASEPAPRRRELCGRLGATVLDPRSRPVSEQLEALDGKVTVAIDAVGLSATMSDALECTALNGRIVLVGMAQPQLALPAYPISVGERKIIGSFTYPAEEFREMAEYVSSSPPQLPWLIEKCVPLEQAQEAFDQLAGDADVAGKILVTS
jgi:2-desacetyl-2-hydroxyethyl bacteriochlorophyllide A dehydrogenase